MSLTIFADKVRFCYKSKSGQYQFDPSQLSGLLIKKEKIFFGNRRFNFRTRYSLLLSDFFNMDTFLLRRFCPD